MPNFWVLCSNKKLYIQKRRHYVLTYFHGRVSSYGSNRNSQSKVGLWQRTTFSPTETHDV